MNTTKRKNRIVKSCLALIMAATVLSASACGASGTANDPPLNPGHTVTDPSGDNSSGNNTPDSPYSQILQNVLNSEYYNELIDKYKVSEN